VFVPVSVSVVLAADLVRDPVPEMLLAMVTSSDRLTIKPPLLTTAPLPSVPVAPPSPI
jgi:hypothetical protein